MEQACGLGLSQTAVPPQPSASSLTLQQSRQVLGVLEEAFSAVVYHLQQVRKIFELCFYVAVILLEPFSIVMLPEV